MAVTSIWPVKGRVDKVIAYVQNPEKITEEYYTENAALHIIDGVVQYAADDTKTERMEFVTCLNCNADTATEEFMLTKKMWRKEDGRLCYHGYQSFKPGEVNARTAHEIGVELARQLWGTRFQVVIATHCNTGTYHNHFVLNSVSFRDGYKFYNRREDYRRMRQASDYLCWEHGLSIIENPEGSRRNYGLRESEKRGALTHSQMIRNDIDRAEKASMSSQAFFGTLKQMGYTLRLYGKSGYPLKHPTITPPGAMRNFRFDSLGEGYDLRSILERVRRYRQLEPPFERPEETHYYANIARMPAKKLTGLRALYFRYCYELGLIKKHPKRTIKVSYLIREDVIKLDRYIAEAKLLTANKIETGEDLEAYRENLEQKLDRLTAERKEYRNLLRRTSGRENGPSDEEIKAAISQRSDELRKVRKALEYCDDIRDRSEQVRDNLKELLHDHKALEHGRFQRDYDRSSYR